MKLVVISPEEEREDEALVLTALVGAGLERYHVRKPLWRKERLAEWLEPLAPAVRSKLVLHTHHDLVGKFGLLGRHWRDQPGITRDPGPGFSSRACHSIEGVRDALGVFSSVLVSPIFPSLSKPGYARKWEKEELIALRGERNTYGKKTELIALGGVSSARFAECARLGFDGVAVMGAIWQTEDAVAAFNGLKQQLEQIHATQA